MDIINTYWGTRKLMKREAIRRHLIEAMGRNRDIIHSQSGDVKDNTAMRIEALQEMILATEQGAPPPAQKLFNNRLYHKHDAEPCLTEEDARDRLNQIRNDAAYYQGSDVGYRLQEWGGVWHIYFRLKTGMFDMTTGAFV
jgi:hypothetical protein